MKKTICAILAILFLFSALPSEVLAAERKNDEHDRLIMAAKEAFPEHSVKLANSETLACSEAPCSDAPSQQKIIETKLVDEHTLLTYQENSDGSVYIIETTSSNPFTPTYTITDSATGSGYVSRTITVRVTATFTSQVFIVDDIALTHVQGAGASVESTGNFSRATTRNNAVENHSPLHKVGFDAFVLYTCNFDHASTPINARIDLSITSRTITVQAETFM